MVNLICIQMSCDYWGPSEADYDPDKSKRKRTRLTDLSPSKSFLDQPSANSTLQQKCIFAKCLWWYRPKGCQNDLAFFNPFENYFNSCLLIWVSTPLVAVRQCYCHRSSMNYKRKASTILPSCSTFPYNVLLYVSCSCCSYSITQLVVYQSYTTGKKS